MWKREQTKEVISIIFVLGRPGSGKGTQCAFISDKFGFLHLSAGELLRIERNDPNSPFKTRLDTHFEEGTTVNSEITVSILLNNILKLEQSHNSFSSNDANKGSKYCLVDGFPPNLENLQTWSEMLTKLNLSQKVIVSSVIYFDAAESVCMTRCLQRGRVNSGKSSDTASNIKGRLMKFTHETMPVIDWFNNLNLLTRLDANKSPELVFDQVVNFLLTT